MPSLADWSWGPELQQLSFACCSIKSCSMTSFDAITRLDTPFSAIGVAAVEVSSRQSRWLRKPDSNRWSHLTYDGDAFQNTSAYPGLHSAGRRIRGERYARDASRDWLADAAQRRHRYFLLALTGVGLVERKWDQRFESAFLQRRVYCEPDFRERRGQVAPIVTPVPARSVHDNLLGFTRVHWGRRGVGVK